MLILLLREVGLVWFPVLFNVHGIQTGKRHGRLVKILGTIDVVSSLSDDHIIMAIDESEAYFRTAFMDRVILTPNTP